jgi:putative flippase GtrA
MVNNIRLLQLLHLPLHIWIHEFGHATVAWWSGYRALPLPIGWTSVSSQRDPFVYFGILFLLSSTLLVSPQGADWMAAGAGHLFLLVLQFYMTWLMPDRTREMLFVFGGVGGEFYLSTFLMASFYFPLPDRWRWDFWRFVVLGSRSQQPLEKLLAVASYSARVSPNSLGIPTRRPRRCCWGYEPPGL